MSIGVIGTVREGIAPGDHLLHCVLEGPEFRISSLITYVWFLPSDLSAFDKKLTDLSLSTLLLRFRSG